MEFIWIPKDFLHQQGLDRDPTLVPHKFPFWRPEPERCGFFQISSQKALGACWTRRPFNETALDYLWYFDSLEPNAFRWTDELLPEVENRVLNAWLDSKIHPRRD